MRSQREADALCADPVYVLQLHRRVAAQVVSRQGPGGSPQLRHAFHVVDAAHAAGRRAHDPARELVPDEATLFAVLRPIFPVNAMPDRDVAALAHLMFADDEDEDGVRPHAGVEGRAHAALPGAAMTVAAYMHVLRSMSPLVSFQVWDAVQQARVVVQRLAVMEAFESRLLDVCNDEADGVATVPVRLEEAQQFLEVVCGLSGSAAQLVAEACVVRGGVAGALDAGRCYDLIFADVIPPEPEFDLLARRFAESTASPVTTADGQVTRRVTGSLALREALLELGLGAASSPSRGGDGEGDEAMDFAGVATAAKLTSRLFFRLCLSLGTGFLQEEADKLFFYLYNERGQEEYDATRHPLLPVRVVLRMFRAHFPAISLSLAEVLCCAVTRSLARSSGSDGNQFFRLYTRLAACGSGRVPLAEYVQALRACGVCEPSVSDLHLEWLRLQGSTRVELLSLLCLPPPPAREAVIRKLFDRLETEASVAASRLAPTATGIVRASTVLARFDTEKMEGKAAHALGQQWKALLTEYFAELEVDELPYTLFSFVWCLLSAAVEDDAMFTMGVWQGFSLATRVGRPVRR